MLSCDTMGCFGEALAIRKRIPAFPAVRPSRFLAPPGPFNRMLDSYTRLASGRAAVFWACRGLRLSAGSRIWMPAFHCGVEVEAAINAGLRVGFYRLQMDLRVDEDDVETKLRKEPGVLFLIHYYGFPQPGIERIARLCRERECVWIEDCAHALFSRFGTTPLGHFAPISVFSLRKTLPLYDGGALQVLPTRLAEVGKTFERPSAGRLGWWAYRLYGKAAIRGLVGDTVTHLYHRWRWPDEEEECAADEPSASKSGESYDSRLSAPSRWLARSADPEIESSRRRRNWQALHDRLSLQTGYAPLMNHLPEGVCPLFLSARVAKRESIMRDLAAQSIETFRFGAHPHPCLDQTAFADHAELRESIICLPIHGQLGEEEIDRIAAAWKTLRALRPAPSVTKE